MHEDILTWSSIKSIILEHAPRKSNVWLIAYRKIYHWFWVWGQICKQSKFLHAWPCLYTCNELVFYLILCYFMYDTCFYMQHMLLGLVWFANARPICLALNKEVSQRGTKCLVWSLFERHCGNLSNVWEPHFTSKWASTWQVGKLSIGLMYT